MAKETKKVKKVEKKTVKVEKKEAVKKPVKETKLVKPIDDEVSKPEKVEKASKTQKPAKKVNKKAQKDTGSADFQVKNFTQKIQSLSDHLKIHSHDFDSRRGLLIMVGKRRRLLNYLKKTEPEKYAKAISDLKLKR